MLHRADDRAVGQRPAGDLEIGNARGTARSAKATSSTCDRGGLKPAPDGLATRRADLLAADRPTGLGDVELEGA